MRNKITPVILCGGNGSRLWPLSRELYPKQFLTLHGNKSMLQETVLRLSELDCNDPIVVCNDSHRFVVADQLQQLGKLSGNIILEPAGRNTAPAIALASLVSKNLGNDHDLLLVLAADHIINDLDGFINSIKQAIPLAEEGKLVTFGIIPTSPETGYGYIKRGIQIAGGDKTEMCSYKVTSFVEKPCKDIAKQYIEDGGYYWNSGMFLFRSTSYLDELKNYRPDIFDSCYDAMSSADTDLDFIRIDSDKFLSCASESIDYAVMEHTKDAVVVPMSAGWSDVGSWSSLWDVSEKDENGNACVGDVINSDTKNSYIYAESALVATLGIENIIVIQTKDSILVSSMNNAQNVKNIVSQLKSNKRTEHYIHREVFRPWGKYDSIDSGERYQVKHLTVKPGEGLSVQMHHHRAEHWIVVSGTAKVIIDGEVRLISENESVYIPVGAKHSLENPGKILLDIIEVRSGAYLEEDDIVRFADRYGRN